MLNPLVLPHELLTEIDGCYNIDYHSETHFNGNLEKSVSAINYFAFVWSFWNFAQSMAVSLPCSVVNFKMIWLLQNKLWAHEIWQDLSLRWFSEGVTFHIVTAPGMIWQYVYICTIYMWMHLYGPWLPPQVATKHAIQIFFACLFPPRGEKYMAVDYRNGQA